MDHWSLILKIIYLTINFFETQEYAVLRMDDIRSHKKNLYDYQNQNKQDKRAKNTSLCWNIKI